MRKTDLFKITFLIAFPSIALLCMLGGQPLIFSPVSYTLFSFIKFGVLICFLCFGLVFISLPILTSIKKGPRLNKSNKFFYVTGTLVILQMLTLFLGYMESALTRHVSADALYYYKGVGNSLIYVIMGNVTAIVGSYLYAKEDGIQAVLN